MIDYAGAYEFSPVDEANEPAYLVLAFLVVAAYPVYLVYPVY